MDCITVARNRDKYQAAVKVAVGLQFKYAETADKIVIFFSAIFSFASSKLFLENFSLAFL